MKKSKLNIAKRSIAVFLIALLTVSSLAACGSKGKNETKAADGTTKEVSGKEDSGSKDSGSAAESITFPLSEPVTMSMFAIMNGEYDLKDNPTFQYIEEKTGVKWDVQSSMGSDIAEKKGLMFASDAYTDVLYKAGLTREEQEKYGKQGILIPLNDLIDKYAPNLKSALDKHDGWQYITASDGNIYSLPELDNQSPSIAVLFLNQVWLKNLGLSEPKNLDELYNVYKAFKEKDANGNGDPNDEIPLIATSDGTPISLLLPYLGVPFNAANSCAIMDDKLVYVPTSDKFKELISFATKLYKDGLLDKNSFTQKLDQQKALGASGDVLGSFFDAGAFLTVGRDRDDDFRILTPFENGVFPVGSGVTGGTFAITDKCKNPEVAMAWIDQFYSEEGGELAWLGIKDKTYKVNADGTWEWALGDYGKDIGSLRANATLQGAANHPSIQPSLWFTGMTDPDEKLLDEERARIVKIGAKPFPNLNISDSDSATLATVKADVDTYINQYIAQVATGELELEKSWDSYLSTLKKMGVDDMIKIYQDAYTGK
ncbi:putative aldouronate transport system substrate-binding protein [Anaerocolumna jejuensis DSM 15929]|uniref:Putative aldouronate transport system substrate-binding protein n=1 Tax=Anaerocolumna jejuensis DSM 15929 TaxID=1121322 RepID=A0A1M7D4X2_9FIRM|nr:extracellular solute-binding protein [Anaerocolumna jejuensis]SHL74552.1 putative aldouronate transport system substrate-binding protein [Anaerocolumna jejuensis DSM 15929]